MSRVYVYVVPEQDGWRVKARGMIWDHPTREAAVAFADSMARRYFESTHEPTTVRVLDADGFRMHLHAAIPRDNAARA